jgi:AcrR family transcriptional regulator
MDAAGKENSSDDRIIGATLALINERGLGGVTMSGIAKAAGVARQTLYNHYSDIDSIVATAISRHNHDSIELLESALAVADSPEDKLAQLVRHVVSVGAQAGHSLDIQYSLSAGTRASLSEYGQLLNNHVRRILTEGIESGTFRSDLVLDWDAVLVRHLLSGIAALAARFPAEAAGLAATGSRTILASLGRGG